MPYSVRCRVENGHIDSVNEFRACTVLFLGFPSLNQRSTIESVQAAARAVQARMHHDNGFFLQMRSDEKGFVALCAFGLPGRVHEDSPRRGVEAALAIVDALSRQDISAVAGVTTGRLFCGVVGSQQRAEYTVYGNAINMASRLMVKASGGLGSVVCDEFTRLLAGERSRAEFQALLLDVKGIKGPVKAFSVSPRNLYGDDGGASPLVPNLTEPSKRRMLSDAPPNTIGSSEFIAVPEKNAIIGKFGTYDYNCFFYRGTLLHI